jgi:hypothetical protein
MRLAEAYELHVTAWLPDWLSPTAQKRQQATLAEPGRAGTAAMQRPANRLAMPHGCSHKDPAAEGVTYETDTELEGRWADQLA